MALVCMGVFFTFYVSHHLDWSGGVVSTLLNGSVVIEVSHINIIIYPDLFDVYFLLFA